jgi:hypothetical protein
VTTRSINALPAVHLQEPNRPSNIPGAWSLAQKRERQEDGHEISGRRLHNCPRTRTTANGNGASRCTTNHILARPQRKPKRCQKLSARSTARRLSENCELFDKSPNANRGWPDATCEPPSVNSHLKRAGNLQSLASEARWTARSTVILGAHDQHENVGRSAHCCGQIQHQQNSG